MKTIALFGGSFNPPHDAHFKMAKYIHDTLNVDEVWMLFSVNRLKDPAKYASVDDRMAMGKIMANHYKDVPLVVSDIEEELGTHITYDVLTKLKERFPGNRFVWIMGADNLASFHKWEHYDRIIENFPVVIVERPPYNNDAKRSHTTLSYPHLQVEDPKEILEGRNGWCFIKSPNIEMSSSNLLEQLRQGRTKFEGGFQDVANYIHEHKLYGIGADNAPAQHRGLSPELN